LYPYLTFLVKTDIPEYFFQNG